MNRTYHKVMSVLLISYLLVLCFLMFVGFGPITRFTSTEYKYNIVPFETISMYMQFDHFNPELWIINLLGNIGVFVPFGMLIPYVTRKNVSKSFVLFLSGLFVLETLQFLLRRGSFDVDDFILNSIGFLIGYGLYRSMRVWTVEKNTAS